MRPIHRRNRSPMTGALAAAFAMTCPAGVPADAGDSGELSAPFELSAQVRVGQRFMGVRLLGSLILESLEVDGQRVSELSGLAYDQDENILYAVSDGGRLFHFRPKFDGDTLTGLVALAGHALRDARGRPLKGIRADSEGLHLDNGDNGISGDGRLTVSFERRPRLVQYSPEGRHLGAISLPAHLDAVANYASANASLESVTRHPVYGWLTAPERPMRGDGPGIIRIWSTEGKSWEYPLREAPNNALVAMEALADGSLVTLERGHGLMYAPVIIAIRRTRPLPAGSRRLGSVATVAVLDSSAGWRVDNFEGLARHRGRRFFLVSDDNQNSLQATLLLYIEMADSEPTDYPVVEFDRLQKNAN